MVSDWALIADQAHSRGLYLVQQRYKMLLVNTADSSPASSLSYSVSATSVAVIDVINIRFLDSLGNSRVVIFIFNDLCSKTPMCHEEC